ncbi:MAG: hypothetical protein V1704_04535 [Candidatus Vogelbacteria bacterium]
MQKIVISIDPGLQAINAIGGEIIIPQGTAVTSISSANSVVKFWLEAPNLQTGHLSLAGIIPGGYQGQPIELISLILPESAPAPKFDFSKLKVLANDGQGTIVAAKFYVTTVPATAEIGDRIPPEEFTPLISSDPTIFNGQKFLVFSTQDKQSGISHYEVCEKSAGDSKLAGCAWQKTESPYLIINQNLDQRIEVKAVDLAGNERVVRAFSPPLDPLYYLIGAILVGVFILWCVRFIIRKLSRSSRPLSS